MNKIFKFVNKFTLFTLILTFVLQLVTPVLVHAEEQTNLFGKIYADSELVVDDTISNNKYSSIKIEPNSQMTVSIPTSDDYKLLDSDKSELTATDGYYTFSGDAVNNIEFVLNSTTSYSFDVNAKVVYSLQKEDSLAGTENVTRTETKKLFSVKAKELESSTTESSSSNELQLDSTNATSDNSTNVENQLKESFIKERAAALSSSDKISPTNSTGSISKDYYFSSKGGTTLYASTEAEADVKYTITVNKSDLIAGLTYSEADSAYIWHDTDGRIAIPVTINFTQMKESTVDLSNVSFSNVVFSASTLKVDRDLTSYRGTTVTSTSNEYTFTNTDGDQAVYPTNSSSESFGLAKVGSVSTKTLYLNKSQIADFIYSPYFQVYIASKTSTGSNVGWQTFSDDSISYKSKNNSDITWNIKSKNVATKTNVLSNWWSTEGTFDLNYIMYFSSSDNLSLSSFTLNQVNEAGSQNTDGYKVKESSIIGHGNMNTSAISSDYYFTSSNGNNEVSNWSSTKGLYKSGGTLEVNTREMGSYDDVTGKTAGVSVTQAKFKNIFGDEFTSTNDGEASLVITPKNVIKHEFRENRFITDKYIGGFPSSTTYSSKTIANNIDILQIFNPEAYYLNAVQNSPYTIKYGVPKDIEKLKDLTKWNSLTLDDFIWYDSTSGITPYAVHATYEGLDIKWFNNTTTPSVFKFIQQKVVGYEGDSSPDGISNSTIVKATADIDGVNQSLYAEADLSNTTLSPNITTDNWYRFSTPSTVTGTWFGVTPDKSMYELNDSVITSTAITIANSINTKVLDAETVKKALTDNYFYYISDTNLNNYFDNVMNTLKIRGTNIYLKFSKVTVGSQIRYTLTDESISDIANYIVTNYPKNSSVTLSFVSDSYPISSIPFKLKHVFNTGQKTKTGSMASNINIAANSTLGAILSLDSNSGNNNTPYILNVIPYSSADTEKNIVGYIPLPENGVSGSKFSGDIAFSNIINNSGKSITYYIATEDPGISATNMPTKSEVDFSKFTEWDGTTTSLKNAKGILYTIDSLSNEGAQFQVELTPSGAFTEWDIFRHQVGINSDSDYATNPVSNDLRYVLYSQNNLDLTKVDKADSTLKLAGAKFEIYDSNKQPVKKVTNGVFISENRKAIAYEYYNTDSSVSVDDWYAALPTATITSSYLGTASIKGLESQGTSTFYLKEIEAPNGYDLLKDMVEFTISTSAATSLTVANKLHSDDIGEVTIDKVDSNTGVNLKGAEFEIQDAEGNVVTLDDGTKLSGLTNVVDGSYAQIAIDSLPFGTYYLVETKVPAGYEGLKERYEFTLDEENPTKNLVVGNNKVSELPSTGSNGLLILIISAMSLITLSVFLFLNDKKKRA